MSEHINPIISMENNLVSVILKEMQNTINIIYENITEIKVQNATLLTRVNECEKEIILLRQNTFTIGLLDLLKEITKDTKMRWAIFVIVSMITLRIFFGIDFVSSLTEKVLPVASKEIITSVK